jgi:hypothetical protein
VCNAQRIDGCVCIRKIHPFDIQDVTLLNCDDQRLMYWISVHSDDASFCTQGEVTVSNDDDHLVMLFTIWYISSNVNQLSSGVDALSWKPEW